MEILINAENAGRRLDKYLFSFLNNAPHSYIYKMLRKKRIKLNASRALGNEMLSEGDVLRFYLSDETIKSFRKDVFVPSAEPIPEIVFEDENLLIVNKPAGLASQGGMEGKNDHLLARLLFYLQVNGDYPPNADFTPGIVNRLDINTSGLVVCGKNLKTLQEFSALFREQKVKKEYLAVVEGVAGRVGESKILHDSCIKDEKARMAIVIGAALINPQHSNMENDPQNEKNSHANTNDKPEIITKFTVLATNKIYSYLLVEPITGRFHQIRAHLAFIGHPLAGDLKYGGKSTRYARNQLLHCHRLYADYKMCIVWEAPLPMNFVNCIQDWFTEVNT